MALSTPAEYDRGPRYIAQVLASLHAISDKRLSLEHGRHVDTAGLYCRVPASLANVVEQKLAAAYPDAAIERLDESVIDPLAGSRIHKTELWLAGDILPIETCEAFEDRLSRELNDPLAGVLGILAAGPRAAVWSHVAIELMPASRRRIRTLGPRNGAGSPPAHVVSSSGFSNAFRLNCP